MTNKIKSVISNNVTRIKCPESKCFNQFFSVDVKNLEKEVDAIMPTNKEIMEIATKYSKQYGSKDIVQTKEDKIQPDIIRMNYYYAVKHFFRNFK